MKTLVFLKTHFINDFVLSELEKIRACDTDNQKTVLFIHNHLNFLKTEKNGKQILNFNNKEQECFIFDENLFSEFKLPVYSDKLNNISFSRMMWYCCDYPFYIMQKYYPDYDYYWQIESDVYCNGESYKPFFEKFENDTNDLLVTNCIKIDNFKLPNGQKQSDEWVYTTPKRAVGMFMVVRMSNRAASLCYRRRLEHAELFEKVKDDANNKWVYCEYFCATECLNQGYTCDSVKESNLRFLPEYDIKKDIPKQYDNMLYHPIKS